MSWRLEALSEIGRWLVPAYRFKWPQMAWWDDQDSTECVSRIDKLHGYNAVGRVIVSDDYGSLTVRGLQPLSTSSSATCRSPSSDSHYAPRTTHHMLTWVALAAIRSYSELRWSPDPGINILMGNNGAGKTRSARGS